MSEEVEEPIDLEVGFSEEGISESIELDSEVEFDLYDALTPFEKLKLVSKKIGIKVLDRPNRDCKLCSGSGVIGYTPVKGSKVGLPIACTCVPIRQEKGDFMPRLNRSARRKQERTLRKLKNRKG